MPVVMPTTASRPSPAIFWHASPVLPGESALLSGSFPAGTAIELCRLADDGDGGMPTTGWCPAQVTAVESVESCFPVIPAEWPAGVVACRASVGGRSAAVLLNAPDPWWLQGDGGLGQASPGGWLAVFGRCLGWGETGAGATVALIASDGTRRMLPTTESSAWHARSMVPADLASGTWQVEIGNGRGGVKVAAGTLRVSVRTIHPRVANVLDFHADRSGAKDSTLAFIQAAEHLLESGGGEIFVPRGRYRLDMWLRPGMAGMYSPLRLPRNVTLRGEGRDLTTLWFTDQKVALPSLIEGGDGAGVMDLAIYTQGLHKNAITIEGDGGRIERVLIRCNLRYMCVEDRSHHGRRVDNPKDGSGWAIELHGSGHRVVDCDIFHSGVGFFLRLCRGVEVARNTVWASALCCLAGGEGNIFADNAFQPNTISGMGSGVNLFYGATSVRHIYWARNRVQHLYGGDHEAMTLDGHGSMYFGTLASAGPTEVVLSRDPVLGYGTRDSRPTMDGAHVFIHAGRGAGQYRAVVRDQGRQLHLDRPWDIEPDADSVVSVGVFSGRLLFIDNVHSDTGTCIQLYPPNCECIVAGNRAIRASNFNCLSKLGYSTQSPYHRVEVSWRNMFIGNRVEVGNGWGGGEAQIDRWIGGAATLLVWGWQVAFTVDAHGCDQDKPLDASALAAISGETALRKITIPLTRATVIRRHRCDNNSSIRIRGAVVDTVIEGCTISDHDRGIRIDAEVLREHSEGFVPTAVEPLDLPAIPFLSPQRTVIRANIFTRVERPLLGNALAGAAVVSE